MIGNIVFRVDISLNIGLGHLMRCLALLEELVKRKNHCYFLSKIDSNELLNKIKKFNVDYHEIKSNVSLEDDLKTLIKFSNENDIDWIITDHYGINAHYIRKLKQNGCRILSIDDTARIHYYSDVVLNQNIGAEKLEFSSENYTKFLLGPKYAVIRDELLKRDKKTENYHVKKILITFGGSDHDNFTLKVLRLLEPNKNVELLVVLGPINPFYNEIKSYIEKSNRDIKLIKSPEDMARIYLESDMAVSAGGTTCYELAYFGIPNIIITIADNQINIAKELDKKGISIYLGKKDVFRAGQFKNKVGEMLNNRSLMERMSRNGRRLVDGKGKVRIVDFMERFY